MNDHDSPQSVADTAETSLDDDVFRVLKNSDAVSLSAPEIAQAIRPGGDWHALLTPIRRVAIALAIEGRIVIYRKGKPADPLKFSGVYRIGLPRQD